MQEQIGNVILDYEYYPGEDLYSDGDVEDELLEIAKTCPQEEQNRIIAEKKSWPVLYHFSHIRENIVDWLPISKEESVLEIGAGCGAVTGCLARKAGSVTCVDLSKKRSMINAYRHQNFENIKICVGNFQDIEKVLPRDFDLITLIGVFEYGAGYIGGESPYVDFLKKIAVHLKPHGQIVIAIENRLGMKYFSGCTEDHAGIYFEGIEGYPSTTGVKTFSKPEILSLIQEAGLKAERFYYPYPDYKLPMAIYSDEYLPSMGELHQNMNNFDRERMVLFNETQAFDSLADSGLFPLFSNSFLVVVGRD